MRKLQALFTIAVALCALSGCGSSQADEKAQRQSERFYEAAFVAWFNEQDNLLAIRNLHRALDANPDNNYAHYLLGTIRLRRGEYDEARVHLEKTVELRREGQPAELAEARNALGVLYIHQKRYQEAVELLEKSAGEILNREPWLALGNLGWVHVELGEYDKALEVLRRAIFDQPRFCVGRYRLGQAHYLKRDFKAAADQLATAVETPEAGCDKIQEAYHYLGMARLRLGDERGAAAALTRCRELGTHTATGSACAEALAGL